MNSIVTVAPVVVFLAAVFTIILVLMTKILRDAAVFGRKTSVVLALSIATVCIVGLWQFLGDGVAPQDTTTPTGSVGVAFKFLLFPYAVLGIAILLQIAVCTGRIPLREASEKLEPVQKTVNPTKPPVKKEEQTPTKSKRGRPTKQKPIEKHTLQSNSIVAKPEDNVVVDSKKQN